mgnify:CR=1 FL=1
MGSYDEEVYYCGKCNSQQQPSKGEKCITCKKTTISWYPSRQKLEEVQKKWKEMRPYFNEQ